MLRLTLVLCGVFLISCAAHAGNWQLDGCIIVVEDNHIEHGQDLPDQAQNVGGADEYYNYSQTSETYVDGENHFAAVARYKNKVTFHYTFVGGGFVSALGTHNYLGVDVVSGATGTAVATIDGGSRQVHKTVYNDSGVDYILDARDFGQDGITTKTSSDYEAYTFAFDGNNNAIAGLSSSVDA